MAEQTYSPTDWSEENMDEKRDIPIHEKLDQILDILETLSDRISEIEINQTFKLDSKKETIEEKPIEEESKELSKVLSDIVENATDGGGAAEEEETSVCKFHEVLNSYNMPFFTTHYGGIKLEDQYDYRLFNDFMDIIKEYIVAKFEIPEEKKNIIKYNLKSFYSWTKFGGVMSTFKIPKDASDEEKHKLQCISKIKSQTLQDESEEHFIYRTSAMIIFQESFKICHNHCKNNTFQLFQKMFNFGLVELVEIETEDIDEEGITKKRVKFTSDYETYLEKIWSYLQIEK